MFCSVNLLHWCSPRRLGHRATWNCLMSSTFGEWGGEKLRLVNLLNPHPVMLALLRAWLQGHFKFDADSEITMRASEEPHPKQYCKMHVRNTPVKLYWINVRILFSFISYLKSRWKTGYDNSNKACRVKKNLILPGIGRFGNFSGKYEIVLGHCRKKAHIKRS